MTAEPAPPGGRRLGVCCFTFYYGGLAMDGACGQSARLR